MNQPHGWRQGTGTVAPMMRRFILVTLLLFRIAEELSTLGAGGAWVLRGSRVEIGAPT